MAPPQAERCPCCGYATLRPTARVGRVVRYREQLPARLVMDYQRLPSDDPSRVRANVVFLDEAGLPVLLVEELESIASAALNRLGGSARTAVEA